MVRSDRYAMNVPQPYTPAKQKRLGWYDPDEQRRQFIDLLDGFRTWVFTERVRSAVGKQQLDTLRSQTHAIQMRIDSAFTLVVLGEFKRGKSTLVNALLRAPVATTDVTPETLTINQIYYGPQSCAEIKLHDGGKVNLSINQLKSDQLTPILDEIRGSSGVSAVTSRDNTCIKLREILTEYFDLSELKDLCFTLGVRYDHLSGETLPDKARELIGRMQRRSRISELIEACYAARPHLKEQNPSNLSSDAQKTNSSVDTTALHAKLAELQDRVSHLTIQIPLEWLRGVCLVDTPGINDLERFDEQVGLYLSQADAIIFVLSARSPFGETERHFLQRYVLPHDFAKVFFVVNEMDRLTSQDYQRLLREISSRIGDLFPEAPIFGISALQEYEHTQSSQDTNVGDPVLAEAFEQFRTTLQDSLLLNRDVIRLERILFQTEEMLEGLENHVERLRWAIDVSQQVRDTAIAAYEDLSPDLKLKLDQHKQRVRMAINEFCNQACVWISEFLARLDQEALRGIDCVRFDDIQRHFHFFLSDSLRAAIGQCIDVQSPLLLDLVSSTRQSMQVDIQKLNNHIFASRNIDQSTAHVTLSNTSWSNLDSIRELVDQSLIGIFRFTEDLVMYVDGLFDHRQKQTTEEHRKQKYQEHLSNSIPELQISVLQTLRDFYHDLGSEVEKLIEENYQQEIENSLSAIHQAQELHAGGEQEFAKRHNDLAEVSALVAETQDKLRTFKQRLLPTAIVNPSSSSTSL